MRDATKHELKILFRPGTVCATPAAIKAIGDADYAGAALSQHLSGFWGLVDDEDWSSNDRAVVNGGRILSCYPLPTEPGDFWIITEADRSATTILLPSDY